jgi:uridine phosphorylase
LIKRANVRESGRKPSSGGDRLKDLVTIDELRPAIQRSLDTASAQDKDCIDQIALFVMDFFGYEERILDNRLTPRDRDIFYMLEGMGLLKTEMEEATIQKGKVWRIHYWILNTEKIANLVKIPEAVEEPENSQSEGKVYENLSESQWDMHSRK